MSQTTGILLFVVGIIVSIMIHEWGHFASARKFGMRADRYFLGFGPTVWSTRRGETEYGVKALPLGGFVRILGMSPGDERRVAVRDEWLDRDTLAAERRAQADDDGTDLLTVPAIAAPSWQRLATILAARGTPATTAQAIIADTQAAAPATPDEAGAMLDSAIEAHVPAPAEADSSSLHHRLVRGDEDRFFGDKPPWQRAIVLAAGSGLHFTIAIVLMLFGLLLIPQPTGEVTNEVDMVQDGSPAAAVGLESGDVILAVDGVRSDDFFVLRDVIRDQAGEPIELEVQRGDELIVMTPTVGTAEDPETGEVVGVVGFLPTEATARIPVGPGLRGHLHRSVLDPGHDVGEHGCHRRRVRSRRRRGAVRADRGHRGTRPGRGHLDGRWRGRDRSGRLDLRHHVPVVHAGVDQHLHRCVQPVAAATTGRRATWQCSASRRSSTGWRRLRGRTPDFAVSHQAVAAVALPVLLLIGTVGLGLVWLDITNPLQLP